MTETIELRTYEDAEVALTADDALWLQTQLSNKIQLRRALSRPVYLINPQQYAGVISLPSGTRLSISPRIPTSNLLFMLAVAYRFPSPFLEGVEQYMALEELLEPVAEYFADLVEERIREGLYRAYVDVEENLPVVRGRIDFPRDIAHNSVLRHRTYCRYSDLTWDIPENQVIRSVCHGLTGWRFRRPNLRRRLLSLDVQLDEVSLQPFTGDMVVSFMYHRLNAGYERIHKLCALFLDASSLSEAAGSTEFRTFLLDMNELYEQFITQSLLDRAPPSWSVTPQEPHHLDRDGRIRLRPDLVIRHEGHITCVADCKFKAIAQDTDTILQDYYQLLAYCTVLNILYGLLIYPRQVAGIDDCVEVANANIQLRRLTMDLSGPVQNIRSELDRLGTELWATRPIVSRAVA